VKNPWLVYTLLRLGTFVVILAILLAVQFDPFYATFIAAVLALAISLIFFNKQRDEVSKAIYEKRHAERDNDSKTEDELLS
jgi:ABC-type transport system involved in cytochrome c biogenesis permease subunit